MTPDLTLGNLTAACLQSAIIALVALGVLRALPIDAPGVRYNLLRVALAFAVGLPLLQPRVPFRAVGVTETARPATTAPPPAAVFRLPAELPSAPGRGSSSAAPIVALLIAGAAGRLIWLGVGFARVQRLRRIAVEDGGGFDELKRVIGTSAEIRYVPRLSQPLTFGFAPPLILLPAALREMDEAVQRAVAAHELWHVRRRDWVWMLGEEALRSALWFHPPVWALISSIQNAREEVVDELAILTTGSRRRYLDALVAFADAKPPLALAMFGRRRQLVRRVLMISKENAMSSTRLVASGAGLVLTLAVSAWAAAAAFPLLAQEPPPPPAAPPPAAAALGPNTRQASEAELRDAIRQRPADPAGYRALAAMYLKAGNFDQAMGTLEALAQANPSIPEYRHQIAVSYWEKGFRDGSLPVEQKLAYARAGLAASDLALALAPDYAEALVYKNLLLRLQASHTTDDAEARRLLAEADALRGRAMTLSQTRRAAAGPQGHAAPPPPPPPPPPAPGLVDGVPVLRVGDPIKPPVKTKNVNAVYPEEARAAGATGVVVLDVLIDAAGRVRKALVLRSNPAFDAAAVAAAEQWEFQPTLVNGSPRPVVMTVTINFALD